VSHRSAIYVITGLTMGFIPRVRIMYVWLTVSTSEMVSKSRLTLDGCVASRSKMLTYFVYAPLLNRLDALLSSVI